MTREEEIKEFKRNMTDGSFCTSPEIITEIIDITIEWADEHPKNPWRDAKKELPNDEQLCIVWIEDAVYGLLCKVCRYFASIGFIIDRGEVASWMPVPE